MRIALGSAAAPSASLGDLLLAAAGRGLAAVELEEGHGHGLDPGLTGCQDAADAAARTARAGLTIAGFRTAMPPPDPAGAGLQALVRFAGSLDAPLLIPVSRPGPGRSGSTTGESVSEGAVELLSALRRTGSPGVGVLPAGWAALDALDLLDSAVPGVRLAWDADPAAGELDSVGHALLERAGARLSHVRLYGGGPEATEQEGRGVGSFMARLAISGYGGTLALVPSSARYRVIWDAWLGRRGGWGCGSASQDRSLVSLGAAS